MPSVLPHGYTDQHHTAWDQAFQAELRATPDDGLPLDLVDWIDFTFLNRMFFVNPPAHTTAALWRWRMHASTPLQRKAAERLMQKGFVTVLDADSNYVRLSATGYRKVARVWEYMASFVADSETVKMPHLVSPS